MFKVERFFLKNQCYLIYNDSKGILIDPAWEYDFINDFLRDNHIELLAVLLTHSHEDHVDLADKFASVHHVPVYMSAEEIDHYGYTGFNLYEVYHLKTLVIDSFSIVPIVTPGHTLGSVCYLIEDHLFSGDTVFIEGVGICDTSGAEKMFDSVQFLKNYLSSGTRFWPGHSFGESPGKDLAYLLKNNIYFQFEHKHHFVDFRTRKSRPNPFGFK